MKKFLVINPFGIGDVLFTTPIIRAIKEAHPDALIGYWCNQRVKDILKNNPNLDKIFALSRGDMKKIYRSSPLRGIKQFLSLLSKIKKEKFDAAIDLSLDHRYSLLSKLLGIRTRIGFNYKKRGRFLNHNIYIEGYNIKHVVEYYLDLLKFIHIRPKSAHLDLFVPEADILESRQVLGEYGVDKNNLLIGIAPGAGLSWGNDAIFKHWPAVKFAELADKIINELRVKLVILGDESERQIADIIVQAMDNKVIDLVGRTNLEELAAMVNNLDLLITNDGGPLHIAVALKVKTISIFGPVDERVYGPYPASLKHIVVKKDLPCRPCYRNFRFTGCTNNRKCIEEIGVDEVYTAVKNLI